MSKWLLVPPLSCCFHHICLNIFGQHAFKSLFSLDVLIIFNTLYNSKGNFVWKIYVYPDTYQSMNTLISRLNTNSVSLFLFISYNLEWVKMSIFLNIYSAIYGELFRTQLSLWKHGAGGYLKTCPVTFVWMFYSTSGIFSTIY